MNWGLAETRTRRGNTPRPSRVIYSEDLVRTTHSQITTDESEVVRVLVRQEKVV